MEQSLYLQTKTDKDSIITTNDLLHTISGNTYIFYPNDTRKAITAKQHDFMTFIFKGLQIMVNKLNNTQVGEFYFRDLPLEEKVNYMQQYEPFFTVRVEDIIPFLERTSKGTFRHISKQDTLLYMEQLRLIANTLNLYKVQKEGKKIKMDGINLFPTVSLTSEEQEDGTLNIESFDLYINPHAIEYILTIFDISKGYGSAYIQHLLSLRSVHSKNLYYFICRYNLIFTNKGYTFNLSLLTKYLGIDKQSRPYNKLIQIIDSFNKEIKDNNCKLELTVTKKGKSGQVKQINLKMVEDLPIKLIPHNNRNNDISDTPVF